MSLMARIRRRLGLPRCFPHLERNVLEVRDLACLKQAMGWTLDPLLSGDHLHAYAYLEDLNQRRLRDAEAIGAACRNAGATTLLEIGTGLGHTTALMAENAPQATVHTVNLPPDQAHAGGERITFAPAVERIGSHYRERGLANVVQILANTAHWTPAVGPIDVAFIDGCHDADFVFNDSRAVLRDCRPGSIVMWHDFAPRLAPVHEWIGEVCAGVERLYRRRLLRAPILLLRDSWVGLYRVP